MNSPESAPYIHDPYQLELFEMPESAAEKERSYEQLADPDLRYRYVRYTENLIARAVEDETDTMLFLDKSARPVSWLMKSLWPTLGFKEFDELGNPIPVQMPEIKFVNFDREQWAAVMGRSEVHEGKGITLEGVPDDTIDSLTGLFAAKNMDTKDYVSSDDPTLFDSKNILIVDEVSASGDTLTMAEKLFRRAFRNANTITGTHWMAPEKIIDRKSGGARNADLPIWYDSTTALGRLVGDRDLYRSGQSNSMRQRRGAQFLSSRFNEADTKGLKLREEMKQLGLDVAEGKMPVSMSSSHRPDDERFAENFMRHVNGLSVSEFARLRQAAKGERTSFPELVNSYKHERNHPA